VFGVEPYNAPSGPNTSATNGLAPFVPSKSCSLVKVPSASNRNSVPLRLAPPSCVEPYKAPSGPNTSAADGS